ncbi:MAG: efflux RND transporter periplasmic adaptor subunit [Candidatus Gastranaerophilales bacterium]|nr:efflux RND transporter periplasmic adaptor subunit [Candidatus Gastranaerophilales bacterium]
MSKKIIIICVILLIAILIVVGILSKGKKTFYETDELKKCTISQTVEASGTINPVNTVSVGSTVSGLIKEIYVDFNSVVKKGQVLAQIDPAIFEATVKQQHAAIVNAQANLAKLQANADYSRKTFNRYQNLYKRNFISKSDLDQAKSTYQADMAQIEAAKAQIVQAQAQYKTALTNLDYTKITAPVDGMIISRKIDVGQPVAASFQAPELFTIAQDLKKMQIEVNVSEADIGKVEKGQSVIYTLDGYPDSEFYGKVTQVRISPTTVSNVVTYSVIVEVENEDLKLKPGMTANVQIVTKKVENVYCVSNSALKVNINKKNEIMKYENPGIWILENKTPKRVEVEIGISDDEKTQIISNKLKQSDKIIIGIMDAKSKNEMKQKHKMPMRMF